MELLEFLLRSNRRVAALIIAAGLTSGALSAALIAMINRTLHAPTISNALIGGLLLLVVGKTLSGALSTWFLVRYAQDTVLDLSITLCRKMLAAPYRLLEETGGHRLLAALTTDVPVLTAALLAVPSLAINLAVVLGAGSYLAWLFPLGFAGLVLVLLAGVLLYGLLHRSAFRAISLSRESRDGLMHAFRCITDGLKELKMSRARREELMTVDVVGAAEKLKHFNLLATRKYLMLDAWSQLLFYGMIAIVLFFFPRGAPQSSEVLSGYVFTALYVMNPIWALLGTIPTFTNGVASLRKIDAIGVKLVEEPSRAHHAIENKPVRLSLSGVEFQYGNGAGEARDHFKLGPIDLTLEPGEILFIVGGNGSGKTTLIKVLTGLYPATSGTISIDGKPVTPGDHDWYREHFSIVFSDFFLFDRLLGAARPEVDDVANGYLAELGLADRVRIKDRTFSDTKLSQGQRKRLAMLTALIEDRPICVFDEWAADQDPQYKEFFYTKLLPKLKADRRSVVVVTHDDRYFGYGDRLLRLEDGGIAASA